jgi:hypothetical protein
VTISGSAALRSLPLVADLNGDKAADFIIDNNNGTISVVLNTGTDFSLSASPLTSGTIGMGQSASSTLSLKLLTVFNNPVSLTCSVQPAQRGAPECSLSANSASFDSSGKASATLTISADAHARLDSNPHVEYGGVLWLPIAGLALFGIPVGSCKRGRRIAAPIVACTFLLSSISFVGCGGGPGSKSVVKNYTVTVTGTSGATQHSIAVNVTVQ